MSIRESVKKLIGISHTQLDSEIDRLEKTVRAELVRLGIVEKKVNSQDDSLVEEAVIDFICQFMASDEKERALWSRAWEITAGNLKNSKGYHTWKLEGEKNV